jgi:hypothetical protein
LARLAACSKGCSRGDACEREGRAGEARPPPPPPLRPSDPISTITGGGRGGVSASAGEYRSRSAAIGEPRLAAAAAAARECGVVHLAGERAGAWPRAVASCVSRVKMVSSS